MDKESTGSKESIVFKDKPDSDEVIDNILHPVVKNWFYSRFNSYSLPQKLAVMEIHSRKNVLVSAPTGATKTLTAFLSILNELIGLEENGLLEERIYCVYISPLKALNNDIEKNLKEPLHQMAEQAGRKIGIRVAVRTGDTTTAEKALMLKKPPHILITTPESLAIVLTSTKFSQLLRDVQWCIIDEVHALAENKRGVHLSLSLERLQAMAYCARIGLSATIAPIGEVAKFLVGFESAAEAGIEGKKESKNELDELEHNSRNKPRPCVVIDVQFIKNLDLKVLTPVSNLIDTLHETIHTKMYELLDDMISSHKTTLIFTNTRSGTERVVHTLKDKFPKKYNDNIGAHHGSLSKESRLDIEQRLRDGKLKCVVSSTSLELGIDIGLIDLVILLGSPKSVARCLQRIGRSGHRLHETAKGRIIVMDRDDMVECSCLLKSAVEKKIDKIHIPSNCLDVLAQQIHGMVISAKTTDKELYSLIRKSYCYHTLSWKDFVDVIDYLAGKYVSLEDRYIYAKIWYDEQTHEIGRKGKMGRVIYMTNIGTIPEESFIEVRIGSHAGSQTVGFLDESFLERLKRNDIFVLGGNVYQFMYAKGMVAYVSASPSRPPTVPSWFSEMLPLSFDLAMDIGKFRRLMEEKLNKNESKDEVMKFLNTYLYVDENTANSLYAYFVEQHKFSEIPTDKKLLVEIFDAESGIGNTTGNISGTTFVFHALFGRRVNHALSHALGFALSRLQNRDVNIGFSDNGFYVQCSKTVQVLRAFELLQKEPLEKVLAIAIDNTETLARRFRHCAARSFMILRNYRGRTKRVGRQQVSSKILLHAVKRISNDFCILKEARREVLEDLMDVTAAQQVLSMIKEGKIKVKPINVPLASPFALQMVTEGIADTLKMEDRVEFLRRMHHKVLAQIALKEKRMME